MKERFLAGDSMSKEKEMRIAIPQEVQGALDALGASGFEAYVVGGCVRDALLKKAPEDWDIATNARPEEVFALFRGDDPHNERAFLKTSFEEEGKKEPKRTFNTATVGVKTESKDPTLRVLEITTFRTDGEYSNKRHPDSIEYAETIEEDLSRRDFTINAMALHENRLVDPFGGQEDLRGKIVRTVGDPRERFSEDALRLLRAVRFASSLGFSLDVKTKEALVAQSEGLKEVSEERIREEFMKIVMSPNAAEGVEALREYGLLRFILPELEEGFGVTQNKHHIYSVWEHSLRALQYAAEQDYSLDIRLAALLHDIGKPRAKRGEGRDATFYGHEVIGARMVTRALERLRFPKQQVERITLLVRSHMFNYDPEIVTDASVRRLVQKVGPDNVEDLARVREADRIGSGVPKAVPYRLRHFLFRVEKVLHDPISRKQMAINGDTLIEALQMQPGPRMGAILDTLFDEVLDDPSKNTKEFLSKRAQELDALSEDALSKLRAESKERYRRMLEEEEAQIKKKYRV